LAALKIDKGWSEGADDHVRAHHIKITGAQRTADQDHERARGVIDDGGVRGGLPNGPAPGFDAVIKSPPKTQQREAGS